MTIGEIENRFLAELIEEYGESESLSLAALAIEDVCDINYGSLFAKKAHSLSKEQEQLLLKILDGLKLGTPIQYLLGVADFYGLKFKVAPGVLIPRPETEELVDWVLKDVSEKISGERPRQILDIGTGSGCIPILLKKRIPATAVISVDVSDEALGIAAKNVLLHDVDVKLVKGDVLAGLSGFEKDTVDIIISNPPYISDAEKVDMHTNVLNNEPALALFVPDNDPLIFYRKILEFAQDYLVPSGNLYLEINSIMGKPMMDLLRKFSFSGELKKDISGNDRMIKAWKDPQ